MDLLSRDDSVAATAIFARALSTSGMEPQQLELAVAAVVEMVEGCDHAGVTMVTLAGLETMAATSELVTNGDKLQYELGEGPCVDTVRTHTTVISSDITSDPRWPRWGPVVAARYGLGSILSILLYTGSDSYGALSCTRDGRTPSAVTTSSLPTASLRTWPWLWLPLVRLTIEAWPWFPAL